jgi:asparagine synthase (glutamine-hydrolysing)
LSDGADPCTGTQYLVLLMTQLPDSLILGSPRFSASSLPLAAPAQAWQTLALRKDATAATAQVGGDFAVGLKQVDGSGFMAVDRFASQTLCYRTDGQQLHFAQRADQLAGPHPELEPQALFEYLYFHVIPSPRTVFRGVHRLSAGRCAQFQNGQLTVAPHAVAAFTSTSKPKFAELRDEFRQLLRAAVQRQLDGSKPACFLSGGTDSSTVTGMVREVAGQVSTYSIGFEAEGYDEMEYARLAARHFGADHHEYYVTPDDLVKSIGHVAASFDQPFGNSSVLPAFYCAQHARQDGVTRILAGDGGDELFGGNSRYAMQEVLGYYHKLPSALRRNVLEPFFGLPLVGRVPLLKKGTGYIRQATTPLPERLQAFNLVRRLGYDDVLQPGFLAQVNTAQVAHDQGQVWAEASSGNEIDRHLAYDWRYTLAESDLPKVRGSASLAGLDVGFPMLDDDLLAFSMRLPPHYKLNRLRLRWFFKEALRGFLPDQVLTKKKQGFGLPFGVWAMRHQQLNQLASDSVRSFATRGIVRPEFAEQLLGTHLPSHPHYYGTMVWILMMAEQWMRVHMPNYKLQT